MASSDEVRRNRAAQGESPAWPRRIQQAITVLVHRSRHAQWPTPGDLRSLFTPAPRMRGVGLKRRLAQDSGPLFHWLEVPADVVHKVWDAIRREPGRANAGLLVTAVTAVADAADAAAVADAAAMATQPVRPGSPGAILADLSDEKPRNPPLPLKPEARGAAFRRMWERPICDAVIPRLLAVYALSDRSRGARDSADDGQPPSLEDIGELARRAIGDNPDSAWDWIDGFCQRGVSAGSLYLNLLEPAARRLGDLWADDDCLDAHVTLGLYRLQLVARRLGPQFHRESTRRPRPRTVLVALQPGEGDLLGPTLASEYFRRDGWEVQCVYPRNAGELRHLLAVAHFDALHLNLNAAFRRRHRLAEMADDIRALRAASRNPAVIVVLYGRDSVDRTATASATGADACCVSAADCVRRAHDALGNQARHLGPLH